RFYESSRGIITIDGEDIRSVDLSDHYNGMSIVSQDAVLYEGSVRFNLTLGLNRAVDDKELHEACDQARILDFVLSLPEGFDSQIGLKGGSMSGGQRQRLCIARALLRNAKILLLDEATSALDNESEALVQQALDRASVGRTTMTVAHRLSTIRGADRIFVLDGGRIVESGSHDELIVRKGRYLEVRGVLVIESRTLTDASVSSQFFFSWFKLNCRVEREERTRSSIFSLPHCSNENTRAFCISILS
ncbi:P-loop containing nucleoside triphosphate hydrolase protein, partial [Mrakia frigida]|uniref:P-loop containing nucleoside triphosphate hydrolase protein n=1 Tax=Mrakia frigida TaxID=29902 RepID=UPI003FCC1E2E